MLKLASWTTADGEKKRNMVVNTNKAKELADALLNGEITELTLKPYGLKESKASTSKKSKGKGWFLV